VPPSGNHTSFVVSIMDIEEYLEQKRALEAKKELLETKERLKEDSERRKRELEKEKRKATGSERAERSPSHEPDSTPEGVVPSDFYRRILFFNFIVLVIIGGAVLGWLYFFQGEEEVTTVPPVVVKTEENTSQGTSVTPPAPSTTTVPVNTTPAPTKFPGPEFNFYVEDKELGLFDSAGKLSGENLVIGSPYYNDAVLHLENAESAVIKCFIDRTVLVDENGDGKEELMDLDLNFVKDELDPGQKTEIDESLPGAFDKGTYHNKGKITAEYEVRCYYCIDPECEDTDKNGESTKTAKVKFQVQED